MTPSAEQLRQLGGGWGCDRPDMGVMYESKNKIGDQKLLVDASCKCQ